MSESAPQPYYPASDSSQHLAPKGEHTNQLAIISLIAGIVSYVFLPLIGSIAAIITGHMALGQIKRNGESGRGFALTGLILGYVNIVLGVVAIVAAILVAIGLFAAAPAIGSGVNDITESYQQAQEQYDRCVAAAAPGDADAVAKCADELAAG